MAEDMGEKTEAPTPRRRQEAREEGQVVRSPDLTSAVLLLASLLLLHWFGQDMVKAMRAVVARMLGPSLLDLKPGGAAEGMLWALLTVARGMVPFLLGMMLVAIAINLAQVGFQLNSKKLQPDLANVNPLTGLARLFQGQNLMRTLMSVLKLLLVGWVAYAAIRSRIGQIVGVSTLDHAQLFGLGADIVYSVGMRIAVVLLVLALLDYGYQRFHFERSLRMSKEEIKEEMRRMEGDPKIKQRRRQLAQQMAQKRLKKDVPTADVVITNPTHFAVALKYDAATMNAPRVVAKGADIIAKRIREIAIEAGVPILERKPLARALYKMCEVGRDIPEEFYTAVAEILAYVYELTGKLRAKQAT